MAALIRTESFWEPGAISPVGAMGLTQVMPETGAGIAEALGIEGFDPASLLRPATSLKFGAYFIGEQLKEFQFPYVALAAYNGGPGRAARWIEAWDGESAASFAEAVDIEETRNYVELVMMFYARYEAAHGGGER
jgi:soluble lytic murein transglycosylase